MRMVQSLVFVVLFAVSGALWADASAPASPATAEVLKLAKAGVGNDILLSFVQAEKGAFRLTSDDILALTDAKVGPDVIKVMLNHDAEMVKAATAASPPVAPTPPPVETRTPVIIDPDPTPNVVIIHPYVHPYWYPRVYYHRHYWW